MLKINKSNLISNNVVSSGVDFPMLNPIESLFIRNSRANRKSAVEYQSFRGYKSQKEKRRNLTRLFQSTDVNERHHHRTIAYFVHVRMFSSRLSLIFIITDSTWWPRWSFRLLPMAPSTPNPTKHVIET